MILQKQLNKFLAPLFVFTFLLSATQADCFASISRTNPGDEIFSFACVYSKLPVASLSESLAGMMILEPDHYSASEILDLKHNGKHIIAYLSVGELETYRSYCTKEVVSQLKYSENPDWPDNFRVKFQDPRWEKILKNYIDEIMTKNFDGIVMDVVDVWKIFPDTAASKESMIKLITSLGIHIRNRNLDSILLFYNSHELFDNTLVENLFDGILQESLFTTWKKEPVDPEWRLQTISSLEKLRTKGKFVGIIEYKRSPAIIKNLLNQCRKYGFCLYTADKYLMNLYQIP
ncbi:MAG: endo alpha-1,4 polygalactosaminidase [Candidatus Riflebacteria bacterium]|nr:endo alpha-1,4 polygalactosaminidase [Candidatus Riflebacteria bacterium]